MDSNFPANWDLKPLNDCLDALIDYRGKTPTKVSSGIPLITAKIVKNGTIETATEFIAEEDYEGWMVRGFPNVGDVVLTTEAPLGEIAQLHDAGVALAQRIVTLRGKKGLLDNDYLLYVMQSKFMQDQLESRATGSTVKGIKQSELRKVLVPLPQLDDQKRIAKILSCIDKKKYECAAINQTLEEMAQAIFKSWFVDFDPVKAKAQVIAQGGSEQDANLAAMQIISGKTRDQLAALKHTHPEQYTQLHTTARLFPSAFVDSELGEIPEGWGVATLDSLTSLITKGTTPSKADLSNASDAADTTFIKVKDLDPKNFINESALERIPTSIHLKALKRSIIRENDILFSIAGTIGRVALVPASLADSNINQAIAVIRLKNLKNLIGFVFEALKSQAVRQDIDSKIIQGVQANVSLKNINEIKLTLPSEEFLSIANTILANINSSISQNIEEIKQLSKIRDNLLPKLLSGEIDISQLNLDTEMYSEAQEIN